MSESSYEVFKALGVDAKKALHPGYPLEQWLEVMRAAAKLYSPKAPPAQAFTALGRRFVDGYGETMMGEAMLARVKVMGVRWTLDRMSRNLSTGSNCFVTQVTAIGPNELELWVNLVTHPEFFFGLVARGLEIAGASQAEVSLSSHEGPGKGASFRVRWVE
jgi:uncharacterized protein (TIGR02265 family)